MSTPASLVADKPAPDPALDWSFPGVTRVQAPGVEVVAAHLPGRAVVRSSVVADAGAVTDPAGREGTAQLLMAAMLRGARGLDEEGLAIAFEMGGATPGTSTGFDSASLSVAAPAGLLPDVLGLVADVVRRPTLDPEQVDRVRRTTMDSLAAAEAQPGHRADVAGRRAFFADRCRYRVQTHGTRDSLGSITLDDVTGLHTARWATSPVKLVLAGDLTGLDLQGLAAAFSVEGADVAIGATDPAIAAGGTRIVLVDVPGSVQSVLDITAPGPAFDIDDAAALNVAQAVVLSAFTARVNQRLREELGYTYGARGQFDRLRDGGTMNLGMQVRTEVTAPAISETLAILHDSRDGGLGEEEVEQARDNLVSRFPVSYDGADAVSAALVRRVVHDQPDDERDVMLANLRTVTADDATASWRRHLHLDELVVTVAGDSASIRAELEELGIGPVVDG